MPIEPHELQYVVLLWNDGTQEYVRQVFGVFPTRKAAKQFADDKKWRESVYSVEWISSPSSEDTAR